MNPVAFQTPDEIEAAIPAVVDHLKAAGLLAYPTETVYGLGSRARAVDVRALARLKGRRRDKPFLLIVSDRAMAEAHGLAFNDAANALARAFWPGPVTLVLPGGSAQLPDELRGSEGGIAVRWTSHPGTARLVAALGEPLTSTSANRPGMPPAPGAAAIVHDFQGPVDQGVLIVLDGGVLGNSPSSTVVDCTGPAARLIRAGAVSIAELRRAAGHLAP